MKIQNITGNNYLNKTYSLNRKPANYMLYSTNNGSKYNVNTISFKGFHDMVLSAQARYLEKRADKILKEANIDLENSQEALDRASDIQSDSYIVSNEARYLIDDVRNILAYSKSEDYSDVFDRDNEQLIREYYHDALSRLVMEEYNQKGKTVRKVIIEPDVIQVIEYNPETGKNDLYKFSAQNDELIEYIAGYKPTVDDLSDDGSTDLFFDYKADKQYRYLNGKIVSCDEKYEFKKDKKESCAAHFEFDDYRLKDFYMERRILPDGTKKAMQHFCYRDNILRKSISNETIDKNGINYFGYEFIFSEDGINNASLGVVIDREKKQSSLDESYKFGDLGLDKVYLDARADSIKREMTSKKVFYCVDDSIKKCVYDYRRSDLGRESYSKAVKVN